MAQAKKTAKSKKEAELNAETVVEHEAPEAIIEQEVVADDEISAKATTKAGKHSAKALKEAAALEAKEERKANKEASEAAVIAKKAPRSRIERAGKKYRELAKLVDQSKTYSLQEALELATKTSPVKFDATVELHLNLGVDPKQADHNVRGIVAMPAGTGKTLRVAVFAEADDAAKAKTAGADISGSEQVSDLLDKGKIDFDVLIATPAMMPKLGKYAKLLGPKGLMPNPKSGTVTADVVKAVTDAKAGQVEFRVDQAGIVHLGIGKVSFGATKLGQNADAIMSAIRAAKPSSLKGNYIESMYITTSMGPSIKVQLTS